MARNGPPMAIELFVLATTRKAMIIMNFLYGVNASMLLYKMCNIENISKAAMMTPNFSIHII